MVSEGFYKKAAYSLLLSFGPIWITQHRVASVSSHERSHRHDPGRENSEVARELVLIVTRERARDTGRRNRYRRPFANRCSAWFRTALLLFIARSFYEGWLLLSRHHFSNFFFRVLVISLYLSEEQPRININITLIYNYIVIKNNSIIKGSFHQKKKKSLENHTCTIAY